jgi:hypothetical protein
MKERELDYKKSMDQLLKDKDDANRQLKMMQEGKKFGIIHHPLRVIVCVIAPCQGIKSGANIREKHGYHFLFQNIICALEVIEQTVITVKPPQYHIVFTVI